MRTIAIGIQKGGVGKTSLSVGLARELAKHGKTLLVDLDPQGQASFWTCAKSAKKETADFLYGEATLEEAIVPTFADGLFCALTFGIGGRLKSYAEGEGIQNIACVKQIVEDAKNLDFVYGVLDLSPSFGGLEKAAFVAADEVITPIMPDPLCIDSLSMFTYNMAQLKKKMRLLNIHVADYNRIIINAINSSLKYHVEITSKIRASKGFEIYEIPTDQVFKRAADNHCAIDAMGPKARTAAELNRFCEDVIGGA
jgi:chromosome partitioning protein